MQVKISSNGQIDIPESIRKALSLSEGTQLNLEVRGDEIVLSPISDWRQLAGAGRHITVSATEMKKREREFEDSRH